MEVALTHKQRTWREWRANHLEQERARSRQYYADDPERSRLRVKVYREQNPDIVKAQYLRRDRKKMADCKRRYRAKSREKIRAYKRAYDARRNASDPEYRLRNRLRLRILRALKEQYGTKAKSTIGLLGCSVANLRIYLESKFESGMTWENHGNEWQIDHIMPCAIFDLSKPEHQKRCFHFSNLQPLWAVDNNKKGAKVTTDQFQLI